VATDLEISNLPPFRSSVLEPSFDLSVGHLERLGKGCSLCRRQVFLFVEALLQLCDLKTSEGCPRLLTFWWSPVLVGVSDTPRNGERRCEGQQAPNLILDSHFTYKKDTRNVCKTKKKHMSVIHAHVM
jgi:hypothetical protein